MRKIVCDKCGKDIRVDDVRYINVQKEDETKVMPEVELCVLCADIIVQRIREDV